MAAAGLRVVDALDVLLIAGLLYAVVRWVRRSQGAPIALGLAILSGLYLAARALDLQMTTAALQGVFALSAVFLAVLFQEELRAGFEQLAAWVLGRPRVRPRLDTTDILVTALTELARTRVGALVVLPGAQGLGRHLRGGVDLDGKLSVPLLESLFDPHSPGHDGAVIVQDRRVRSFGVQLPLARAVEKLGRHGTRHSAALGLAERTDALSLVVSEELGTLSVAHRGELRELPSAAALGPEIDRFYRATLPLARGRRPARRLLLEHGLEKAVALLCSLLLWWLFVAAPDGQAGDLGKAGAPAAKAAHRR